MAISIAPGAHDRAILVGRTGSGKSTLARELLSRRNHVAIIDAKGLLHWRGYHRETLLKKVVKSSATKVIYAPSADELRDRECIEAFFRWVYLRGNCTLYVDEAYGVTWRDEIPPSYHACLTRGRELGISVLSATQRPKLIPQVLLSESEHYYVFKLLLPQDRKRLMEVIGIGEKRQERLQVHQFIYANATGTVMGPLRLDLKGR